MLNFLHIFIRSSKMMKEKLLKNACTYFKAEPMDLRGLSKWAHYADDMKHAKLALLQVCDLKIAEFIEKEVATLENLQQQGVYVGVVTGKNTDARKSQHSARTASLSSSSCSYRATTWDFWPKD